MSGPRPGQSNPRSLNSGATGTSAGVVRKPLHRGRSRSLDSWLKEGAVRLRKARFGFTSGDFLGPDPADGFDARYWREDSKYGGVIHVKVEPWRAMRELVKDIDKDVPRAGGGTTRWTFECMGFVRLLRVYAYWRVMSRTAFNRRFRGLTLGVAATPHASSPTGWKKTFIVQWTCTDKPTYVIEQKGIAEEKPVGKTWAQLLKSAPVGTHVTWTNDDAKAKCGKNPNLPFGSYVNENATKVGLDQYSAHPFGVVSEKTIKRKMAEAVAKAEGTQVTQAYIDKYIFVSLMRYPKRSR